ncbi:MAG: hypothetical protein ACR2GH_08760 [Pseudonocardia sp.]
MATAPDGEHAIHQVRAPVAESASMFNGMPANKRTMLRTSLVAGAIALFPQALVPTVTKTNAVVERVWFLALHLPEPLQ